MQNNLHFFYLGLDEMLKKYRDNNIREIEASLLISLEKEYYAGTNMKLIIKDLKNLTKNKKIVKELDGKLEEFQIKNINIFIGDALNHHMFYYRHCADYFDKHNIDDENLIPKNIKKEFIEKSYIDGMKEGEEWFRNNYKALQLFSNEKQLTQDYDIHNDITTLFEETEDTPKLTFLRYNYFYQNQEYHRLKTIFDNMLLTPGCEIVDRCYLHEAESFYKRLESRNETPKYKELFIKQSKKYLIDETIPTLMFNQKNEKNNYFDIYYFGTTPNHYLVYDGKKGIKNKIIQNFVKNDLFRINECRQIS